MKKIRLLALSFIVSMSLMGAGYASWADSLVIGNTVSTGSLNMNFVNNAEYPKTLASEFVISSAVVSEDKKTVTVKLENLYPGAYAAFKLEGINAGTIPAKITGVNVEILGDKDELLPYLTYDAGFSLDKDGDDIADGAVNKFSGSLENIGIDFNAEIQPYKDLQLEPNNKGNIKFGIIDNGNANDGYIIIHFDEDAPSETQDKSIQCNITFDFVQFNVD
ncbi:MAG: hypothetical protein ACERKV_12605 [Clostridiaceae bacterium]